MSFKGFYILERWWQWPAWHLWYRWRGYGLMRVWRGNLTVGPRRLTARWSMDDMAACHSLDAEAELTRIMVEQLDRDFDEYVLHEIGKGEHEDPRDG